MSAFTEETCFYAFIHQFGKSIPTMAYQTFLFVPDSIKLGRGTEEEEQEHLVHTACTCA